MFFLQIADAVYIISFATVVEAPVGIARAGFTLIFSLNREIIKRLQSRTSNNKKKHNEIHVRVKSKLNSVSIASIN